MPGMGEISSRARCCAYEALRAARDAFRSGYVSADEAEALWHMLAGALALTDYTWGSADTRIMRIVKTLPDNVAKACGITELRGMIRARSKCGRRPRGTKDEIMMLVCVEDDRPAVARLAAADARVGALYERYTEFSDYSCEIVFYMKKCAEILRHGGNYE